MCTSVVVLTVKPLFAISALCCWRFYESDQMKHYLETDPTYSSLIRGMSHKADPFVHGPEGVGRRGSDVVPRAQMTRDAEVWDHNLLAVPLIS
jgi:hypothetical protein